MITDITRQAGEITLGFAATTGAWTSCRFRGDELFVAGGSACFAVHIAGWEMPSPTLLSTEQATIPGGERITFTYRVSDGQRVYRLCQQFDLCADPARIERRLMLQREDAGERDQLLSVSLLLDGLTAGDAARTTVTAPMARLVPTPLAEMLARPRDFATDPQGEMYDTTITAPDGAVGVLALHGDDATRTVTVTPLPWECPVRLRAYGHEGRFVVEDEFLCESWITTGAPVPVATQVIHLEDANWQTALPRVGTYLAEYGYAPTTDHPAWAHNPIVYEAELKFEGGLRQLTARLDELQALGFNTIYLMPWHTGCYGTIDYLQLDPAHGTFADLRAFTDAVHQRGMHVLFDMLVNIATEQSPYPKVHPEWFYRDVDGQIIRHPLWGGYCFDPAAPGFRQFLTDYAVRCCTEWGADGFRVDAAAYRGGNWQNLPGLQPHQHAHAVFTLLGEVRAAIRSAQPEAILLAECFGPVQCPVSDLVCHQWLFALDWLLQGAQTGTLNGATLQRLFGEHMLSMPHGALMTLYTHTHDTLAFLKRDLEGPAISALFATWTLLSAGTMVFGGGWEMHHRPRPEEAEEYRALFAEKTALGGVAACDLRFPATDDPALFIAERPALHGPVRVITNFSDTARAMPTGAIHYARLGSAPGILAPWDTVVLAL